ncbi:hypothetical protein RCL1_003526 [Eukaryota sp. TZLM3-RCL]
MCDCFGFQQSISFNFFKMFKVLAVLLICVLVAHACSFSCGTSSCRVNGGSRDICACDGLKFGSTTAFWANCRANGATSCELSRSGFDCSIEGDSSVCNLQTRTSGLTTWFVPTCTAKNAPKCTQTLGQSSCSIVGTSSVCSTEFLKWSLTTWIVPTCTAKKALQCSISCGSHRCDRDCSQQPGKSAFCHCAVEQLTPSSAWLTAKCGCK